MKLRPNIEDHDYLVKLKNAQRFLADGDKVKVTIMFRGRELAHPELGKRILVRMAADLKDIVIVEREPKLEGKNMIMILAAKQVHVVQATHPVAPQDQIAPIEAAPAKVTVKAPVAKPAIIKPTVKKEE